MADLQLEFLRGRPAPDVLGGYASLCEPLDAAGMVAQWEATAWDAWRWMVARDRAGEVVAALPAQLQAGKTAMLWPVRTAPMLSAGQPLVALADDEDVDEPPESVVMATSARLLQEFVVQPEIARLALLQVVLPAAAAEDVAVLAAVGFQRAAELLYLACDVTTHISAAEKLVFRPITESDFTVLTAIIDRTYDGTLDCPAVNGFRDTADVVAGYATSGTSGTAWWRLAEENGAVIGCVLTATHPSTLSSELVYMGLCSSVRGRALGGELIREALRLARESGMEQSVLAVDAANRPALDAYRRAGYQVFDRRCVWLRRGV